MSAAQLRSLQEEQTPSPTVPRRTRTRRERLRVLEKSRNTLAMSMARDSPQLDNEDTCGIFESAKGFNSNKNNDNRTPRDADEKKEELPKFEKSYRGGGDERTANSPKSVILHRPLPERPGPSPLKRNNSSKRFSPTKPSPGKGGKDSSSPRKGGKVSSSPMARMRDVSTQEASTYKNDKRSSKSRTPKSHEQIKKEKQQKWKRQMKKAQKYKMRERKALEAGLAPRRGGQNFMESVLKDLERNGFFDLIRTQCGTLADAASESSDDSSDVSSDTGDESDSSQENGDSPPRRSRRGKSKTPKRKSPSNHRHRHPEEKDHRHRRSAQNEHRRRQNPVQSDPEASPPTSASRSPHEWTQRPVVMPSEAPMSPQTADGYLSPGLTEPIENLAPPPPISRQTSPPPTSSSRGTPTKWTNPTRASTPVSAIASPVAKPNDKFFVKAFITEAVDFGFSMLWHKEQASMKPAPVTLRLKSGNQTPNTTHCGPRLVWSDQKNDRYGFSLFHIRSLERAKPNHLKDVPFAIPGRSICLKLHGDRYFVFEASSEDEAWRFVHGLRWVIARLSFNLVIGNVEVSCELLDIKKNGIKSPPSLFEDFQRAKAMDDVTEQLVDSLVVTEHIPGTSNTTETPLFPAELSNNFF